MSRSQIEAKSGIKLWPKPKREESFIDQLKRVALIDPSTFGAGAYMEQDEVLLVALGKSPSP